MIFAIVLSVIFIPACVTLLVNVIYASTQKASTKTKKNKFTVYIPKLCAVIGVADALCFGLFILFSPIIWPDENNYMVVFYMVFGAGLWAGVYLIIKTLRFRIVVEDKEITVYPLFSKAYTFTFDDVEVAIRQTKKRYKGQAERIIVCTKQGKRVIAESSFVAYFKLVDKIQECVDLSRLTGFDEEARNG